MKRIALLAGLFALVVMPGVGLQAQTVSGRTAAATNLKIIDAARLMQIVPQSRSEDQQKQEAKRRQGRGPAASAIALGDLARVGQLDRFPGVSLEDLCRLSLTVYPDVNPDSRIFYYRPRRFVLRFDPGDGYYLNLDYKAGGRDEQSVLVQARLTPGFGQADKTILKALLMSALGRLGTPIDDPILLPLPATYDVSFDLQNWEIQSVTVNGVDPESGEIVLSLAASVPDASLVANTLGNLNGLVGTVQLTPSLISPSQSLTSPIQIPASIRLADIRSTPPMTLAEASPRLKNLWPFDLKLSYLCYLTGNPANGLRLRGWNLGNTVLHPGDSAELPAGALNAEVQSSPAVFVADLMASDEALDRVVQELTGGVGALPVETLTIEAVGNGLFEQYNLHKILVEVSSTAFDPEGRTEESHLYTLTQDEPRVTSDPLYLQSEPGSGLYRYRVGIITLDGEGHQDTSWRSPGSMLWNTISVGSKVVEEVLAQ
jgi:hypothetical protein